MLRRNLCVASLLVLLFASPSVAEENNPPDAAAIVAPFVGEETMLVMRFSPRSTEVDRIFNAFGSLIPLPAEARAHLDEEKASVVTGLQKMERAGGKSYFLTETPWVVFCPLPPGGDHKIIAEMYPPDHVLEMRGNVLVIADNREAMNAIKAMKLVERPELRPAFAAAGSGYAQFVLLPPRAKKPNQSSTSKDEHLMVFDVVAALFHDDSPNNPFDQISWAAVGVDLYPDARIRAIVQCKDADGAKKVSDAWQERLHEVGKDPKIGISVEDKALLPLLQPKVEQDRLVWSINERSKHWNSLLKLIAAGLFMPEGETAAK